MYKNIEFLIFRSGKSKKDIAKELGLTYNTFILKLNGKANFTLNEAMHLKEMLQTSLSIEELFDKSVA